MKRFGQILTKLYRTIFDFILFNLGNKRKWG